MDREPLVSVIIPNLNSPMIDRTLDSLRHQRFDLSLVEILVVGLDAPKLVQEDELVHLISTKEPTRSAVARNMGIQVAQGDFICFLDADCIADAGWLSTAIQALEQRDVVGGGVRFVADNYWTLCDNLGWFYPTLESKPCGEREILPTLNLCVRREVIEMVGELNPCYPKAAGEDAEWTTRMRKAGYRLWFVPHAIVEHHPGRASFGDIWRHASMYGRYSVKLRPEFFDFLRTPFIFRRWWALLLATPFISLGATLKVYIGERKLARYWYAFPGIWLGKFAWCLGALHTLWDQRRQQESENR